MADVEIRSEREDVEGIVAVGTYLSDAMRRLGVRFECDRAAEPHVHGCIVTVKEGAELLSPLTEHEKEILGGDASRVRRLACETRIERGGTMVVMTDEAKRTEDEARTDSESYIRSFADLPLDKKFADLVKLEAMALGDTISFLLNSPYKIVEKVADMLAQVGHRLDAEKKRSSRPAEHAAENAAGDAKAADGQKGS
ncbi:MAG: hypothetical protein ACK4S4_09680 [Pyrinomonadaceae bacterium]